MQEETSTSTGRFVIVIKLVISVYKIIMKRKAALPKLEEMTKDEIRKVILKKKQTNALAQRIVETLLEPVSEEVLLKSLPQINQSHFQDIIEERAITFTCGYPLCCNSLPRDIPKQQFRISLKTNKVYDITDRKYFCSNKCYQAAMYLKNQMLTSPLWFRDYETIPTFLLLKFDSEGSLGKEIDLSLVDKIEVNSVNELAEDAATSTELVGEPICNEVTQSKQSSTNNEGKLCPPQHPHNENILDATNLTPTEGSSAKTHVKVKLNSFNIIGDVVEKNPSIIYKVEQDQTAKPRSKPALTNTNVKADIVIQVEKIISEWFTLDSMIYLYGEDKVKELVADRGEIIKEYLNNYANTRVHSIHSYDQYLQLCKKLNLLELEDKRYKGLLQRERKPLPDYSVIKEDSKLMELKVKAYFAGDSKIPEAEADMSSSQPGADSSLNWTQLPVPDTRAQHSLRRKIVLTNINKVLPEVVRSLGLEQCGVEAEVQQLVKTFKLQAHNVMLKGQGQWVLLALVLVALAAERGAAPVLRAALARPAAYRHLQLLLLTYNLGDGYLQRLIETLTDINRLIKNEDSQFSPVS